MVPITLLHTVMIQRFLRLHFYSDWRPFYIPVFWSCQDNTSALHTCGLRRKRRNDGLLNEWINGWMDEWATSTTYISWALTVIRPKNRYIVLYCIVLYCIKHLNSASSGMNRSEALPVCKAPWEKKIGFEKGKRRRRTTCKKSRAYRRRKYRSVA